MLKTRVITSLVLLAIVLPTVWYSMALFFYLVALILGVAAWEWNRLLWSNQSKIPIAIAVLITLLNGCLASDIISWPFSPLICILVPAILFWLLLTPIMLYLGVKLPFTRLKIPLTILSFVIFPGAMISLNSLENTHLELITALIVGVWTADIGAYFAGRKFGVRKLAPHISPNKSWEGVAGGFLLTLVFGVVLVSFKSSFDHVSLQFIFLAALFVSAYSVQGDLLESLLKRLAGVKDSSQLLPGHGGVLDRIDGILPVVTLSYLFVFLSTKLSIL